MYCPQCGVEVSEDALTCPACGASLQDASEDEALETELQNSSDATDETQNASAPHHLDKGKKEGKLVRLLKSISISKLLYRIIKLAAFCVLAGIVYQACQNAASSIAASGAQIGLIESVGGRTLEEAYYQQMGGIYLGYASFVRTIGTALAGILIGLGLHA